MFTNIDLEVGIRKHRLCHRLYEVGKSTSRLTLLIISRLGQDGTDTFRFRLITYGISVLQIYIFRICV